jgi:hypothetical protein
VSRTRSRESGPTPSRLLSITVVEIAVLGLENVGKRQYHPDVFHDMYLRRELGVGMATAMAVTARITVLRQLLRML